MAIKALTAPGPRLGVRIAPGLAAPPRRRWGILLLPARAAARLPGPGHRADDRGDQRVVDRRRLPRVRRPARRDARPRPRPRARARARRGRRLAAGPGAGALHSSSSRRRPARAPPGCRRTFRRPRPAGPEARPRAAVRGVLVAPSRARPGSSTSSASAALLGIGPLIGGALPLQQLTTGEAQPLLRVVGRARPGRVRGGARAARPRARPPAGWRWSSRRPGARDPPGSRGPCPTSSPRRRARPSPRRPGRPPGVWAAAPPASAAALVAAALALPRRGRGPRRRAGSRAPRLGRGAARHLRARLLALPRLRPRARPRPGRHGTFVTVRFFSRPCTPSTGARLPAGGYRAGAAAAGASPSSTSCTPRPGGPTRPSSPARSTCGSTSSSPRTGSGRCSS